MGSLTAEHVLKTPEYAAAFRYVTNEPSVASDAFDTFCQAAEDKTKSGSNDDVEQALWRAWKSITAIAASAGNTDAKDEKLAEFVLKLQQREAGKGEVQGMKLWQDLPIFGWQIREAWNEMATEQSSEIQQHEWLNLNSWTAVLANKVHTSSTDRPDLTLQGIWTIRAGLEEEQNPANISIAAAATWIAHAGPALAELSKSSKTFDGKMAKPGSLFSDREWRGYTTDRWQAWLQRLKDVQSQSLDDQTSKLLKRAIEAIEKS